MGTFLLEKELFAMECQIFVDKFIYFCMGIVILDGNVQWLCPFFCTKVCK